MKSLLIEPLEARIAPATLAIAPASVFEGDSGTTKLIFTVTLSEPSSSEVTVDFATEDVTATIADNDYEAFTGTLTFEANQTSKTIEVNIIGDLTGEANETFKLKLSGASGATISESAGEALGTIKNDGIHVVGPRSFLEGDSGTKSVDFTVRRETLLTSGAVTVNYATADGTATASGGDYESKTGSLNFADGEVEKTFSVVVKGDTVSEADENFRINLTGSNDISIPQTVVTILNDGGVHFVGPVSILEGDDTRAVTFTLRREGVNLTQPLTVHYATADGTATVAGEDYEAAEGDVTFAAGETQKTFTINIKGDNTAEEDETFKILLSGGADFLTTTPETVVTLKNDGVHIVEPVPFLEGDSGTRPVTFTVRREIFGTDQAQTVNYTTADGTATVADNDYETASGALNFAAGEVEKTFTVDVNGDDKSENDENFKILLTSPQGGIVTAETLATIKTDAGFHFVGPVSILEGDTTRTVTFTVRREALSATTAATIHYKTQDGSATQEDEDYTAAEGDLVFAAGETQKTFTIEIKGDLKAEADETFKILLTGADGTLIGTPETEITIQNDGLHINSASIVEGDSGVKSLTFDVIRETLDLGPATVKYSTVDGTATLANRDYQQAIGTLVFAQGETAKTISVNIIGDLVGENDETFKVKLSDATGATIVVPEATGTILNDAKLKIVSTASRLEGDSGKTGLDVAVTLVEGPASGTVTVKYRTEDLEAGAGSATAGQDYDAVTEPETLTFSAGQTTKNISIQVSGDLTGEEDESFKVALQDAVGATIIAGEDEATATILNDAKFTFVGPELTNPSDTANRSLAEGDSGTSSMNFQVRVVEAAPSGSRVKYSTTNIVGANAALAGEDYTAISGVLTASEDGLHPLPVQILGDYKFEADETFTLSLSSDGTSHAALPQPAVGTITSDDELTISDYTLVEGNDGSVKAVFTVTLKEAVPAGQVFRVAYATQDVTTKGSGPTADYAAANGTLQIAAGQRAGIIEIEVFGDLNYEDAVNQFKVVLGGEAKTGAFFNASNLNTAVKTVNIGTREGVGTITDGADAPPTISIADTRILEGTGEGKKQMLFTLTLSKASDYDVEVDLSTIIGSADGSDFDGLENQIVTIPAGSATASVAVLLVQDSLLESDETFSVKINEAIIKKPGDPKSLEKTRDIAIGTIVNDESYVIIEPVEAGGITEGDTGTKMMQFRVKLFNADGTPAIASTPVVVTYSTEDSTALAGVDYEAKSGTVEIAAGQSEVLIEVPIIGDTQDEGGTRTGAEANSEKFNLKVTGATNAKLGATGDVLVATGTILDDDNVPTVTITHLNPGGSVTEGGQLKFKVELDRVSDHAIEIPYSLIAGTAKGGAAGSSAEKDYIVGSDLKIVIPAGQREATITVDTVNDSLSEADETFKVKLGTLNAADATAAGDGELEATIKDDNDALPTISVGNYVIVEGDSGELKAQFVVKLSAVSGQAVKVGFRTIDGSATSSGENKDYTATTGTVTIPAGELTYTIEVPIIGDTNMELDENFFVRLEQLPDTPPTARIVGEQGTGTIINDETQYKVLFKTGNGTWSETIQEHEEGVSSDRTVTFKIVRTGAATEAGSVRFSTEDGTNVPGDLFRNATGTGPRADYDYATGVATFAAGQTDSEEFQVTLNGDQYYEGIEEFRIALRDAVNGVVSTENAKMGTVQILDNEAKPTISFEQTAVEVNEGGLLQGSNSTSQQTAMTFKIKLSGIDETGTVTMRAVTESNQATATGDKKDYELLLPGSSNRPATPTVISFAPGETEKSYTFTVLGDHRYEDDESIKLTLSELHGGSATFVGGVSSLEATGKIINDDAKPVINITELSKAPASGQTGFQSTTYLETDGTGQGKFFVISLFGETDKPVTVQYYTKDGTAKAGEDFVGISEGAPVTLTFDPNATGEARTSQKIFIPIFNDEVVEGNESFEVYLTGIENARPGDIRGSATIEDNDNPIVRIEDMEIVEGDSIFEPTKAKFIVRLAAPAERDVVVNFTTADGTAKASGLFADYIARQGKVTFAPGETMKEIEIDILGDTFAEGHMVTSDGTPTLVYSESFQLKLSGSNVTFARDTATGTILNGSDTQVGVGIHDLKVVEGTNQDSFTKKSEVVKFEIERSIPAITNTSYKVALRSGTATIGSDFAPTSSNATPTGNVTINAGQTSAFYQEYSTVGDANFEFSEHFFADITTVPEGVQLAKGTARAEIFDDDVRQINARTVQWIDLDGDLVTLKVSKGSLDGSNVQWVVENGKISVNALGGRALSTLNLFNREFQDANVTITAERQPGFTGGTNGVLGDGRVNVGFIQAGGFVIPGVSFTGVDLGTVKVDGDLGGIYVGDRILDGLSLRKLEVFSLGAHPESTNLYSRDTSGQITGVNTGSYVQGAVGSIKIRSDFAGTLQVTGAEFGDIQSLKIGGALRGLDSFSQTGTISFTGTLNKATIGEILGGVGNLSGRIEGDTQYVGNINSITVQGDMSGNGGDGSAVIAASSIGKAKVGGRLQGGGGDDSGQIRAGLLRNVNVQEDVIGGDGLRSGAILTDRNFGSKTGVDAKVVKIGGRVIGGSGELSGLVSSQGGFDRLVVVGEASRGDADPFAEIKAAVAGGEGKNSGRIEAGGLIRNIQLGQKGDGVAERISLEGGTGLGSGVIDARGGITTTNLFGAIQGGDGADSGALKAAALKKVRIFGDLRGGDVSGSGVIAVDGAIGSLVLDGYIRGGSSKAATQDSAATSVNTTGAVLAGQINSMIVTESVIAGRNLGTGLSGSASIAVNGVLSRLTIKGSLLGHDSSLDEDGSVIEEENVHAKIIVFGDAKKAAIGKLKIGEDVSLAEISAGVSIRSDSRGFPVNADAWIKSVEIGGNVRGMNITAGANTGPDGLFATADDAVLSSNPQIQINDPNRFSAIASVIIKGSVAEETEIGSETLRQYGLVAQYIGSVKVGSQKVSLTPGAGTDKAPGKPILLESFRAIELPIS